MSVSVLGSNESRSALTRTVDEIRVFHDAQGTDGIMDVRDVERRQPVTALIDRASIDRCVTALQQLLEPQPGKFVVAGCSEKRSHDLWHVLLLDRDQMRVGYVLVRKCRGDDDQDYAEIRAYQGPELTSSVYYNRELLQYLVAGQ
jgi:hypothetical protein